MAHNGEINTLKGNVNWMKTHEAGMESDLIENMDDLKPIIKSGNSDTASLDAAFELLVRTGRSLPIAKMMLIPEAWSKKSKIIPKAHREMYNYLNSLIEPWDGPAAIAACDGKWLVAASDRNGLRPLRYTITKDKLFFAGSETGMMASNKIKLRNLSGTMNSINSVYKYYNDKKTKDHLSANPIYKKFASNHIELSKMLNEIKEKHSFEGSDLRERQVSSRFYH